MTDKEFLAHHGILGMKWGVRRTPEQLGHRTKGSKKGTSQKTETKEERHARLLKTTKASELYKHKHELTNSELKERIERINMERQLKSLSNKEKQDGLKMAKRALDYGKTASEFYNLYNSPMGKAAKKALKKTMEKGSDK